MEDSLHYNLLAAHTLFQKTFLHRLNREYPELLPGQPKIIDYLMSHPRSFQRKIAEGCLIEPATLSPILEKMERSGLIRRDKAADNRKNSIVSLSENGTRLGIRIQELFRELEAAVCSGLTPDETRRLLRNLQSIQQSCRRELA